MKIIRILILIFNLIIINKAFSQSSTEIEDSIATRDSNDVVSKIAKISEHGDLSDDAFFARSIGVNMDQLPDKVAPFSFQTCGVTSYTESDALTRRYVYTETPRYLIEPPSGKSKNQCEFDYIKRVNGGGKISKVIAKLQINVKNVCISPEILKRYFPEIAPEPPPVPPKLIYEFTSKSGIKLSFMSSMNKKHSSCIELVLFSQTY